MKTNVQLRKLFASRHPTPKVFASGRPTSNAQWKKVCDERSRSGFTSIGGQTRNNIARLDATTGLADSFNPNANGGVSAIAVQAGGNFTSIGGQTRNNIARLDGTTGLADSFDPNPNDFVNSIAIQEDGKMLVSGQFNSIGGQHRRRFARLSNDTAALQNLAVTQVIIT
jgi:Domain of unknown function (DUF5122) beta-propeller